MNVLHKLFFSHKDFTAMNSASLGEFVTLLAKVRIQEELMDTSDRTKIGSYMNKNMVSEVNN